MEDRQDPEPINPVTKEEQPDSEIYNFEDIEDDTMAVTRSSGQKQDNVEGEHGVKDDVAGEGTGEIEVDQSGAKRGRDEAGDTEGDAEKTEPPLKKGGREGGTPDLDTTMEDVSLSTNNDPLKTDPPKTDPPKTDPPTSNNSMVKHDAGEASSHGNSSLQLSVERDKDQNIEIPLTKHNNFIEDFTKELNRHIPTKEIAYRRGRTLDVTVIRRIGPINAGIYIWDDSVRHSGNLEGLEDTRDMPGDSIDGEIYGLVIPTVSLHDLLDWAKTAVEDHRRDENLDIPREDNLFWEIDPKEKIRNFPTTLCRIKNQDGQMKWVCRSDMGKRAPEWRRRANLDKLILDAAYEMQWRFLLFVLGKKDARRSESYVPEGLGTRRLREERARSVRAVSPPASVRRRPNTRSVTTTAYRTVTARDFEALSKQKRWDVFAQDYFRQNEPGLEGTDLNRLDQGVLRQINLALKIYLADPVDEREDLQVPKNFKF